MARKRFDFARKTTLITGASTGIGAELARELAKAGSDLVLVARSADKLDALAAELSAAHGIRADVIAIDLAAPGSLDTVVARVDDLDIALDVLVNNAGFANFGDLSNADFARVDQEVALNVGALTGLTARLLPRLRTRPEAAIINVASNAAFQPIPHMAVYAATKAFVLSFSRALWGELRGSSVRVLAVCPGPTETPFFEVAGEGVVLGKRRTPADVVATTLRALDTGKPSVVDGFGNAFVARVGARLAPERFLIAAAERYVRPRS